MEYYLAIKRNEESIHAITWINLANKMLAKLYDALHCLRTMPQECHGQMWALDLALYLHNCEPK
jgi:hypothetical protein